MNKALLLPLSAWMDFRNTEELLSLDMISSFSIMSLTLGISMGCRGGRTYTVSRFLGGGLAYADDAIAYISNKTGIDSKILWKESRENFFAGDKFGDISDRLSDMDKEALTSIRMSKGEAIGEAIYTLIDLALSANVKSIKKAWDEVT